MTFSFHPILALLQLKPITDVHNSWVFYWLIGLSILLVALKILFPKRLTDSTIALISIKSFGRLKQDGFIPSNIVNILLTALYIASLGLFISVITNHFYHPEEVNLSFSKAFYVSLIAAVYILAKFVFILITQWIYQAKDIAINYLNVLVISYNIFGTVIFFGLWLILYTNFNFGLILTASILSILFVIRLLKLASLSELKNNFSLFSFIVYICTVEILPLIIAQKLYIYWVLAA
jgi:hypothetical protein